MVHFQLPGPSVAVRFQERFVVSQGQNNDKRVLRFSGLGVVSFHTRHNALRLTGLGIWAVFAVGGLAILTGLFNQFES